MKEFISILFSFIFMGIADNIDSAFNNAISIDTIIVCGSLVSINLILRSFTEMGTYIYRIIRKNEWQYLWLNIIISLFLGITVFLSRDIIVNFFSLTINQKQLLSNVLVLYILYLVTGRLANDLFEISRLKKNLKLYRNGLIIFYVLLIGLDSLVFIFTRKLELLFVATIVSWIIITIYMLYKLRLKFEFPSKETIKNIYKYGIPMSLERFLSRVFILIYGVLASHLGTNSYSIHSICYSVCLSLEIITNAYQAALMIKVPEGKDSKEQYKICMEMMKKSFKLIVLLNFIFAIIYLLISHGSLPLYKCFPYIIFYSFGVFGLYPYETYKTLCIAQGRPIILLIGSTIGSFLRVIICILFLKTPIAIYVFGIVNLIDFYIRSRIYKKYLKYD